MATERAVFDWLTRMPCERVILSADASFQHFRFPLDPRVLRTNCPCGFWSLARTPRLPAFFRPQRDWVL